MCDSRVAFHTKVKEQVFPRIPLTKTAIAGTQIFLLSLRPLLDCQECAGNILNDFFPAWRIHRVHVKRTGHFFRILVIAFYLFTRPFNFDLNTELNSGCRRNPGVPMLE